MVVVSAVQAANHIDLINGDVEHFSTDMGRTMNRFWDFTLIIFPLGDRESFRLQKSGEVAVSSHGTFMNIEDNLPKDIPMEKSSGNLTLEYIKR